MIQPCQAVGNNSLHIWSLVDHSVGKILTELKAEIVDMKGDILGMKGDIAKIKIDVAELKSHHLAQVTPEMLSRSQVNMRIQTVGLVEASRLAVMNAIEPRLARAEPIRSSLEAATSALLSNVVFFLIAGSLCAVAAFGVAGGGGSTFGEQLTLFKTCIIITAILLLSRALFSLGDFALEKRLGSRLLSLLSVWWHRLRFGRRNFEVDNFGNHIDDDLWVEPLDFSVVIGEQKDPTLQDGGHNGIITEN